MSDFSRSQQPSAIMSDSLGLYIHCPFCVRKCPYCDFNTYAGLESLYEPTVDALCAEIASWKSQLAARTITSVFVGGGTPTALPGDLLSRIFDSIHANLTLRNDCEITVEANPGTVDQDKFRLLHDLGANRLSLGVQSFQPSELSFLGRIHSAEDAIAAFAAGRSAGFENINLDFIFGIPHQTLDNWADTLDSAVQMGPEHLSLYSLIVEPNTPLNDWVESGQVVVPDDDEAGGLYEYAIQRLDAAGYLQYEVSNWSRDGDTCAAAQSSTRTCAHNLLYWRNGEYVGIGPGAHSHMRRQSAEGIWLSHRWANVNAVPESIARTRPNQSREAFHETLDQRTSMGESMVLGLRMLCEGVRIERFIALHGISPLDVYSAELSSLQAQGLLSMDADAIRLTRRGLMLANQVSLAFIADEAETSRQNLQMEHESRIE